MMIATLLLTLSNGDDNEDNYDKYLFLSVVLVECDQVLVTQIVIGGKEGSECFLNFTIYLMNLIIIIVLVQTSKVSMFLTLALGLSCISRPGPIALCILSINSSDFLANYHNGQN